MKLIRRPVFWITFVLILYATVVISRFWLPAYGVSLNPEAELVIKRYFAAAKMKDVAIIHKLERGNELGPKTEAGTLFYLENVAPFYAANDVVFKKPHYIMLRAIGKVVWVDCTALYDEGKEWDFSVLLLKTEDGWKIDNIFPEPEQRIPEKK